MRLNFLLFALGAWLLQMQAALPSSGAGWAITALLAGCGLACRRHVSWRKATPALAGAAWFAAGFMWAATAAQVRMADALPKADEGRDIEVVGVVATLPQPLERGVRFEFDVERTLSPGMRVPRHIALSWWGGAAPDGKNIVPALHAGERWRLTVRLKRPHGMVNPRGFDYEAWLLERGIRATGYVRGRRGVERLTPLTHGPVYWAEAARGVLRERILAALAGRPYAGVLAALAIGDQRAIPPEQWQTFTRTGVNHLMSISGLHITMISGLVFAFAHGLWRRSARLTLALPARKAAVLAGVTAALCYTVLAGFAVPAQRTLYMLMVIGGALWADVFTSATRVLAAALLVVVMLDPWAVLAPGFWLSFGAVAVILFVSLHRVGPAHWLQAWARTQWAVTVGLVPLLLALFQQLSIVSPLANAFAIPAVSLGVVPLVLVGMLMPFDALLQLAHGLMSVCMAALEWLSTAPGAVWQQHAPAAWTVAAAIAGVAWLLLPRGFPARGLGAVAMLPLFLVHPSPPAEGELRLTVLDVGHGLAIVAQTARHALLYDAGPAYGPGADAGNRIVAPFLRAAGVGALDGLIVTHDDADHYGGAASVLQAMPVAWLMSSLPETDPLHFDADRVLACQSGMHWLWDGVRFEILHPAAVGGEAAGFKDNDRSCVLRIATQAGRVLLPADIERRSEALLLAANASALAADVLVAPHQGSKTSSSPAFVQAVGARAVIFPVGYRNRFGHPHETVVERYRASGAALYRTDEDGAIRVTMRPGSGIALERARSLYRRYWHDAPGWQGAALDDGLATFLQ